MYRGAMGQNLLTLNRNYGLQIYAGILFFTNPHNDFVTCFNRQGVRTCDMVINPSSSPRSSFHNLTRRSRSAAVHVFDSKNSKRLFESTFVNLFELFRIVVFPNGFKYSVKNGGANTVGVVRRVK